MIYEIKNLLHSLKDQYYISAGGIAEALERKELLQQCRDQYKQHYDQHDQHIQNLHAQHLKQWENTNFDYYYNWIEKYQSMIAEITNLDSVDQYPELIKNKMVHILNGQIGILSERLKSHGLPYPNIADYCNNAIKTYQFLIDEIDEQLAFTEAFNSMVENNK